jgi:hypothetical protein
LIPGAQQNNIKPTKTAKKKPNKQTMDNKKQNKNQCK